MATESDLGELLLRWDERRQQGQTVSAEELCAGAPNLLPELKRRIEAVQAMERRLGVGDATVDSGPSQPSASDSPTAADLAPAPEDLHIPGYEILGLIDQGGMGVVYKALHVQLKRTVALKMIRAEASGGQRLARFRAEAEAVARLQHPNIVQIYEVGESNNRPYFTMEFVEGGSLAQVIAGRPLPHLQAAELVARLAEATHFAHQRGIVHRDLKPANVLLSTHGPQSGRFGTPKITDFGLAKRLDTDSGISAQTQSGVILGTPSYMAPEQAAGKAREVGPSADVYALGAILYDALTGSPPFKGETPMETLLHVMSSDPVPPSRSQPKVPRDLETICLKCLEKSPARRYASAAALADDLHCFLKGQPIAARSISVWRRGAKWARRRPETAALLTILLLTLFGLMGRLAWLHRQEEREAKVTAERLTPRVREILHDYCYSCHGQDPKHVEGDFDVLDYQVLVNDPRGLVVPFHVPASRLIHRIEDNSMPPEEEEEFPRLGSEETEVLKKWVIGGAPAFPGPGPDDRVVAVPDKLAVKVKEIFRNKCQECHRLGQAKNGIKILNHDLLTVKRKVVIPGDPDESRLFQSLFDANPKKVMPPLDMPQLTPAEFADIRRWIAEGAVPFPREHKAQEEQP